mmetsp:Transcript_58222/g.103404  ORF Transcript_58222/g.103404 Transcript_58222/m.103404 type:complete len:225 (-) Transcript_58222:60-734(-)
MLRFLEIKRAEWLKSNAVASASGEKVGVKAQCKGTNEKTQADSDAKPALPLEAEGRCIQKGTLGNKCHGVSNAEAGRTLSHPSGDCEDVEPRPRKLRRLTNKQALALAEATADESVYATPPRQRSQASCVGTATPTPSERPRDTCKKEVSRSFDLRSMEESVNLSAVIRKGLLKRRPDEEAAKGERSSSGRIAPEGRAVRVLPSPQILQLARQMERRFTAVDCD